MKNSRQSEIDSIRQEIFRLSERLSRLEHDMEKDEVSEIGLESISLEKVETNKEPEKQENIEKPESVMPGFTPLVSFHENNGFTPLNEVNKKQRVSKIAFSENLLGTSIMGIVAALLIFIGLVSFMFITLSNATVEVQSLVLNVIALGFFGVGLWMLKRPNILSYSIASCGIGSVFISILATGLYFQVINQIVLFVLLVLWSGVGGYLGKRYKSNVFLTISSIGYYIALILGLLSDYNDNGMFMCFVICMHLIYSLFLMHSDTWGNGLKETILLLNVVFEVVYIGIGYMSISSANYLVEYPIYPMYVLSMIGYLGYVYYKIIKNCEIQSGRVIDNFYFVGLILSSCFTVYYGIISMTDFIGPLIEEYSFPMCEGSRYNDLIGVFVTLSLICMAVKYSSLRNKFLERVIVSVLGLITVVQVMNVYLKPFDFYVSLFGLLGLSMMFMGFSRYYKSRMYGLVGNFIYTICWLSTWLSGSNVIDYAFISVFMVILIGALNWYIVYEQSKVVDITSYLTLMGGGWTISWCMQYLFREVISWESVNHSFSSYDLTYLVGISIISGIVLFVYYLKSKEQKTSLLKVNLSELDLVGRINYALSIIIAVGVINSISRNILPIAFFYTLLGILLSLLDIHYCMNTLRGNSVLLCIKYTYMIELLLHEYLQNYDLGYLYSLIGIIIAIVCIVVGFLLSHKYFRIYGLALSLICVLKLVLIDISYDNSIERVISFIIGGFLCFGIVFIYNKMFPKKE